MMKVIRTAAMGFALVALVGLAGAAQAGGGQGPVKRIYDGDGALIWEIGKSRERPELNYAIHYTHKPNHQKGGGGGGGDPGGGSDPGTDCSAKNFSDAPWRWSAPISVTSSAYVTEVAASFATWDAASAAPLVAGVSFGDSAEAGTFDGQNQVDWVSLGASSTIAVTTTWYNRFTGEAVESDMQYNTYYAWATDGSAGAMDVENIATHEAGHTFGLDHPNGNPRKTTCLTMYAYASEGETQKRTLGDGDILGLQAMYGA